MQKMTQTQALVMARALFDGEVFVTQEPRRNARRGVRLRFINRVTAGSLRGRFEGEAVGRGQTWEDAILDAATIAAEAEGMEPDAWILLRADAIKAARVA